MSRVTITKSFDVTVTGEDAGSAALAGAELGLVSAFLGLAAGIPHFDVACGGRLFRQCRLSRMPGDNSIPFTCGPSTRRAGQAARLLGEFCGRLRQSFGAIVCLAMHPGSRNICACR